MKVHVILTNKFDHAEVTEVKIKRCVCAVIDTIRATSTIAVISGSGAKKIVIARDKVQALFFKSIFRDFLLCGEEKGIAPKGFDYGNSPVEISGIDVHGKDFILMTTNGTQSLLKIKDAKLIYTLAILNMYSVLNRMLEKASKNNMDILLLCSGQQGKIAYDDAYTAGLAVKYLMTRPFAIEYTDSSKLVLGSALSESQTIYALEKSYSAKSLRSAGLGDDIVFLSQTGKYNVCPRLVKISTKKDKLQFFNDNIDQKNKNDLKKSLQDLLNFENIYYLENDI
jgi:2-phosphosulfolactate phosphatase